MEGIAFIDGGCMKLLVWLALLCMSPLVANIYVRQYEGQVFLIEMPDKPIEAQEPTYTRWTSDSGSEIFTVAAKKRSCSRADVPLKSCDVFPFARAVMPKNCSMKYTGFDAQNRWIMKFAAPSQKVIYITWVVKDQLLFGLFTECSESASDEAHNKFVDSLDPRLD